MIAIYSLRGDYFFFPEKKMVIISCIDYQQSLQLTYWVLSIHYFVENSMFKKTISVKSWDNIIWTFDISSKIGSRKYNIWTWNKYIPQCTSLGRILRNALFKKTMSVLSPTALKKLFKQKRVNCKKYCIENDTECK